MKTFTFRRWRIVIPFLILLAGCTCIKSHQISNRLIGYWKLDDIIYEDISPDMQGSVKNTTDDMKAGSYLELQKNHRFNYKIDVYSGANRWKLMVNKNEIVFDSLFLIHNVHSEVRKLTPDTLYLRVLSGEMKIPP